MGSRLSVPERRIEEVLSTGLLHLELVLYEREPSDPTASVHIPIGSERFPNIPFMQFDRLARCGARRASMLSALGSGTIGELRGLHAGNGATLYTMCEHYRNTHDDAWCKRHRAEGF
jgi:hypothetical protein